MSAAMQPVPDAAVEAVAGVLLRQYDSEDSTAHLTWEDFARPAREILEVAAPVLAEARKAAACPRRAPGLPAALAAHNAARARATGHRDAGRAAMILARYGDRISPRQRLVAEAKIAAPEKPWAEIADGLGMTKDQACGLFRRLLQTARARMEAGNG